MEKKNEKLGGLNSMLSTVENNLLRRSLDRAHVEVEHAYDFINQLADEGTIDIECAKCDQEIDPDLEELQV
jgi:hypothetical protein